MENLELSSIFPQLSFKNIWFCSSVVGGEKRILNSTSDTGQFQIDQYEYRMYPTTSHSIYGPHKLPLLEFS